LEADRVLIDRVLEGDPEAFAALYERYRVRIELFARSRLTDLEDAQELTQEVFLEMHRSLPSYRGEGAFGSWLCGIAYHLICAHWRKRPPAMDSFDDSWDELLSAPTNRTDETLDAQRVLHDFAGLMHSELSPEASRIFRLHCIENRPIVAVSRICGKKQPAVRASLVRARRKLRKRIPDFDELVGG
jgi:RNA polymerase sigma-70 factor (ECF subfamily)